MKVRVSPAVLIGPALDQVVFEAVDALRELGAIDIHVAENTPPTQNPAFFLSLMDILKIDLFWHDEYNGVEQSVVEADCTLAGPIREASEIDAVASDVMTAVYRAFVIYVFGNEVEIDSDLATVSELSTGIHNGNGEVTEPEAPTVKTRRGWMPWHNAASYIGKKVLLRFKDGHVEDATIQLDTDTHAYYYLLFDGETLNTPVVEFMLFPERGWTLWHECQEFLGERVLVRFQSGHAEDAYLSDGGEGQLIFTLSDGQTSITKDDPVAAMPIP